jgi:hypothetical protein
MNAKLEIEIDHHFFFAHCGRKKCGRKNDFAALISFRTRALSLASKRSGDQDEYYDLASATDP